MGGKGGRIKNFEGRGESIGGAEGREKEKGPLGIERGYEELTIGK